MIEPAFWAEFYVGMVACMGALAIMLSVHFKSALMTVLSISAACILVTAPIEVGLVLFAACVLAVWAWVWRFGWKLP